MYRVNHWLYVVAILLLCFSRISESVYSCGGKILLRSGLASETDKQIILNAHNSLRQRVALGQVPGQPQASNLQEMGWDDELAYRAQSWSGSCFSEEHDNARHVPRFAVGQNIATFWTTKRPSTDYEVLPDYAYAIKQWFNEYRIYGFGRLFHASKATGHYTQMVWAETNLVGCGYSLYYDPAKGFTKNYICNYAPSGNIISQTPYIPGPPSCLRYGMQNSHNYYGLCLKGGYNYNYNNYNSPVTNNNLLTFVEQIF